MSHAAKQHTIIAEVPVADFYRTITDYGAYPAISDEVKSARVISRDGHSAVVAFTSKIMMKGFDYTLRMTEDPERHRMSWTLVNSSVLTENRGGWTLEALSATETRITYEVALGARVWVPSSFINSLSGLVLPKVMKRFAEYTQSQLQTRGTRVA
jgi:ribosome-associated toxin RatA of RatAB toxin-antitoxin module